MKKSRLIGKVVGDFDIVDVYGDGTLEVYCVKCGYIDRVEAKRVLSKKVRCKNCAKPRGLIDRTGQVYGTLKVIDDRGGDVIHCVCTKCLTIDEYTKNKVVNESVACTGCGALTRRKKRRANKKKSIRNSDLAKWYIIYRNIGTILDEAHYKCKCRNCGQVMILSEKEMWEHVRVCKH